MQKERQAVKDRNKISDIENKNQIFLGESERYYNSFK